VRSNDDDVLVSLLRLAARSDRVVCSYSWAVGDESKI